MTSLSCAAIFAAGCAPSHASPETYSGKRLFEVFCASCHGLDARGNGPVAPVLKVEVPDLTRLAARNNGRFSAEQVYRSIDGQAEPRAHGDRHMPVWGYEFFGPDPDDRIAHRQADEMIVRLVAYLRSIQGS